ncbi:MAG: CYTH domain-containing protein [Verrucomicrobiales bacterium]
MKLSHAEIERKFLVAILPPRWQRHPHAAIAQGYLAIGSCGEEVRLRRIGRRHFLTVKRGRGTIRQEVEIALTSRQFSILWPLTKGRRLRKSRYRMPHGRLIIELDIYHGKNRGLKVAEIEFPSSAASQRFRPEAWMGREVTAESQFQNQNLAG